VEIRHGDWVGVRLALGMKLARWLELAGDAGEEDAEFGLHRAEYCGKGKSGARVRMRGARGGAAPGMARGMILRFLKALSRL